MQVIAQLAARAEDVHIDDGDLRSLADPGGDDSGQRVVESLDVGVETRLLRWDDLGHNDDCVGDCLQNVVEQESKTSWRISIWLGRRVSSVQVVGTGMEQDDVGL